MKQRLTPLLAALLATSLTACASNGTINYCPVPVYPDECALRWVEASNPPPCFVEFFDRYERQQGILKACR